MERTAFLNKVQQYKNAIDVYSGPDPLKPWYEYIVWLEKSAGKENSNVNIVLEQTLQKFQDDSRYSNDTRFVELLILFARLKGDKLSYFQKLYECKLGSKCSIFYKAWSDEFISYLKYSEAYKVLKKGYKAKAQPLEILGKAEREVEMLVGKNILQGITSCNLFKIPCECNIKDSKDESGPVKNWEMNPLKSGEPDNFTCPLIYPEEDNPNKISIYPKHLVYYGSGEYQLEEIMCHKYLEKLRMLEAAKKSPVKPDCEIPVVSSLRPDSPPFKNLLPATDSISCGATSFTERTTFAFNLVKGMWDSPKPPDTFDVKDGFKVPEVPKPVGIPSQFAIYNDSILNEAENVGVSRGCCSGSTSQKSGLSERKFTVPPSVGGSGQAVGERVAAKHQLMFGSDVQKVDGMVDDDLATCLDTHTIASNDINKLQVPSEWNYEDVTCNTKVFNNFVGIASTPNVKAKDSKDTPLSESHANSLINPKSDTKALSVILEASKEVTPSSGSYGTENKPPGISEVERSLEALDLNNINNPFCPKLIECLLKSVNYPVNFDPSVLQSYHFLNTRLPNITKTLKLGNNVYSLTGESFKGAYAKVLKVTCNDNVYAMKIEKPACHWEYYICKEIRNRVDPENVKYFGDITCAFFFQSGSIFISDFAKYKTLLNVINQYKLSSSKQIEASVSTFLCLEVVSAVHYLNSQCNIIHGDIKPDNFLVHSLPNLTSTGPYVQLIDFGRSIDMKLLPKSTKFNYVITTDGFQCNEMKESKPWTYQTDLYGLAGTMYCILVGDYMKVIKKKDNYVLARPLPRLLQSLWNPIFARLLNIESCDVLPDLNEIKQVINTSFNSYDPFTVRSSFNALANVLNGN